MEKTPNKSIINLINENVYITNDDYFSANDWVLLPNNEIRKMSDTDMIDYLESDSSATKKIILTTDPKLIADARHLKLARLVDEEERKQNIVKELKKYKFSK